MNFLIKKVDFPYLTIHGTIELPKSRAIARYLAKQLNLAPDEELEQAKADAIVDTCDELLELQIRQIGNKKEVNDDELKQHLDRVEKVLGLFKGEGDFSVGASLTWADLAVFDATSNLSDSQLTQYERIRRVRKSVEENQRISGYLKYRPTSPFIIPEAL